MYFLWQASNDSGRGASMTDVVTPNTSPNQQLYHCNFPTAICGRLIGKQGKNINFIKEKTGANITLSANPFTPEFQLCSIEGKEWQKYLQMSKCVVLSNQEFE
jgi:polyribonucleotide nucleotidyltransferase